MKCPKCGYLGFETTERCRHCGYDFSLTSHVDAPAELPLRASTEAEAPLADFELAGRPHSTADFTSGLDLDRLIGQPEPEQATPPQSSAAVAVRPPAGEPVRERYRPGATSVSDSEDGEPLPLFTAGAPVHDDSPLTRPRPARPPLAVRRATPELARRRTPRTIRREDTPLAFELDTGSAAAGDDLASDHATAASSAQNSSSQPRGSRLFAALIDAALLGAIDFAVIYFTLAIAGLTFATLRAVPPIPMAAFLLLLNGGYLVAFTAAQGQTIGKMLARLRVVRDDGTRVDVAGAVVRGAGLLLSLATLGLPYLPALFTADGRALHDRLAGTRVVKIA